MIIPDSLAPVTDEDLKRLRGVCETAIKSGHVGISVVALDVLRVVTALERMRADLLKLAKIMRGPGEALNQDG